MTAIRTIRKRWGITAPSLARRFGLADVSTWTRYETGRYQVPPHVAAKMTALDAALTEIFTPKKETK